MIVLLIALELKKYFSNEKDSISASKFTHDLFWWGNSNFDLIFFFCPVVIFIYLECCQSP